MEENEKKPMDLTTVITTVIQIPGVKVSRNDFLREQFKEKDSETLELIIEKGPVNAGCTREEIRKKAEKIVNERTTVSTGASFLAGIPGGLAMAATIPADMLQFYSVALRMAQELVYLYGEEDLWVNGTPDADKVTNQLILYCGVMLGAFGASQMVRVMSSALAQQLLKTIPQKALTKTFYYPIVKSVLKFFGVHVTKNTFAKGVSKFVPIIGGLVSGGITLATMLPMGNRLVETLDKAHFDYTEVDFEEDMHVIDVVSIEEQDEVKDNDEVLEQIQKAKKMFDDGIITEEEFVNIKSKLIKEM